MNREKGNGRVKVTCRYDENGEDVGNILAECFASFLAGEAEKSEHDQNRRLLAGGAECIP